ncbi:MAG: galactokinase, partial [Dinghuibacter sp.]|nr:galactokinase [Dinghuibacter sp.]
MDAALNIEFKKIYGTAAEWMFYCAGRVNLIGEHTDYNGGLVMPCAISMGTHLLAARNNEGVIRLHSLNEPGAVEIPVTGEITVQSLHWVNYPLGVIHLLKEHTAFSSGFNLLYQGNLPVGAGLSSSAALAMVTAFALNQLLHAGIPLKELALLCQKAEHEFAGVPCGIMDQYAVAFGKKDNAILLNCALPEHEYIPFNTGEYQLLIVNTNKPRKLVESKYNERLAECTTALRIFQQALPVEHLCAISFHEFEQHRHLLQNATLEKRVLHLISEQFRVGEARDALRFGELFTFGKLMYASHRSLKEFYEVTGP